MFKWGGIEQMDGYSKKYRYNKIIKNKKINITKYPLQQQLLLK